MTSIYDARWRYANHYLSVAEEADQLFSRELTQEKGVSFFDQNREQIESALAWITEQDSANQIDILLARFVDAISSIGLIRYSVREKLIPLNERKIAAAQSLGWKDLEADSFDGLGIVYAYLGYLPQAIHYFKSAYEIANQIGDKELKRNIQTHIRLAQKQLKQKGIPSSVKFLGLIRFIPLQVGYLFARIIKNPFMEIATLNSTANIYLDWEKWDLSIQYYRRAISIAKKYSYRFGELQACMGLLQAEMSKDAGGSETLPAGMVSGLASDFEWSADFSVLETLLAMAPAIQSAEAIAIHLANENDPRASIIYEQLDQIMLRTDEIVSASNEKTAQKQEIFLAALRGIKDNLETITNLNLAQSLG